MINIITANLLAERPYRKYSKVARPDFAKRSARFRLLITQLRPDVMLLQEVDGLWRECLELHLAELDYFMHFGACWSSGLAILWRNEVMQPDNTPAFNVSNAGVLAINLISAESGRSIRFINLHAPWGKAEKLDNTYLSVLESDTPILIAGDLNTDDPGTNDNAHYFFKQLLTPDKGFVELTNSIPFTARNVKSNKAEKLDYIVGRNITGNHTRMYPKQLSRLLPHSPGGAYHQDTAIYHFSDHALLASTIM